MLLEKLSKFTYIIKNESTKRNKDFLHFKRVFRTVEKNITKSAENVYESIENPKYVFIRLYNPEYEHNLPAKLLQKGQDITNVSEIKASHAAIGFDLKDSFYGLTLGGKYDLKIEQCTDINSCEYMQTCNPLASFQYTFALPVTAEEYDDVKKMVENYYNSHEVKYAVFHNFPVAVYCLQRKLPLPGFPTVVDYENFKDNLEKKLLNKKTTRLKEKFICSTFCTYVLMHCVPRISKYFNDRAINYDFITPSDLPELPGIKLIFSSNWSDFKKAAAEYAADHPEFKPYL
ncbi:MAG: hypothetical protein IJ688_04015 [Treponema sp.]|nr:hypothetical protein [Treponema sp.]